MYQQKLPIVRVQHFKNGKRPFLLVHTMDRHQNFHITRHSIKSPEYQNVLSQLNDNFIFTELDDYDLYERKKSL